MTKFAPLRAILEFDDQSVAGPGIRCSMITESYEDNGPLRPDFTAMHPSNFTVVCDSVFFDATNPKYGWLLWVAEMIGEGGRPVARLVKDLAPYQRTVITEPAR